MPPRTRIPTHNHHPRLLWPALLWALLLLMLTTVPGMAAVRATLDRAPVYTGDIFTLTIENDGLSSGQQPDLAPLEKDFDVLGTSTSTQVSIFNGRRSDKMQWHIQLQARRPGQLRIPPLSIGGQQTAAIELNISEPPQQSAAQTGQHIFIETDTRSTHKPVYVQQQVPYTVRLYYDDRLQSGELSAPTPENAVVEQLGKEKRYDTVRNGRQYHVIERNYVISAEKSGELHIPPAVFRGRLALPQQGQPARRARSPLEEFINNSPFANDPFFRNRLSGNPFGDPGQPITIRSQSTDIPISPRPATAGHDWLPAEEVTLSDSWAENPPQLKAGEPVSRTITIQTKGLSGSQTPELSIDTPANSRLYPEASTAESRTDGATIYGVRTQTLTYIPSMQGMLEVPAITLDWWDTRQNKPASTTLPAWQFNVLPGDPGNTNEAPAAAPSPSAQSATTPPGTDDNKTAQANQRWLIMGGGAVLALLLAILVWRARQQRPGGATAARKKTHRPERKSALRDLQKACATNNPQSAAQALLSLAQSDWPDDPPHSLAALATRIETGQAELHELDRNLYAIDAADWNGATLWNEFKQGLQKKKTSGKYHNDVLKPLYPDNFQGSSAR